MGHEPAARVLVNQQERTWAGPSGAMLLDVLRREWRLVGTREGCREGDCGACLVLLGEPTAEGVHYRPVTSCLVAMGDAAGRHVVTVEGVTEGSGLSVVQQAIVDEGATQCGFCTSGIVLALTSFLLNAVGNTEEETDAALGGNICRCTGYASIRRAAARVRARLATVAPLPRAGTAARTAALAAAGLVPDWLAKVGERLGRPAPRQLEAPGVPPGAVLVGGGTDLFVQRPEALEHAPLAFVGRRPGQTGVRLEGGVCRVGASTTFEDLGRDPLLLGWWPELPSWWRLIASQPIRHRATVAGNIVNASPIGDLTILLLALDARLVLRTDERERTVPLRSFYRGYKQVDLAAGEVVAEVAFDEPRPGDGLSFEKVSRRTELDIASVNGAMSLRLRDGVVERVCLSAGGVAPVPLRLLATERRLVGRRVDERLVEEAMGWAREEIAPISDVRGSAAYKRELLGRIVAAHFLRLCPEVTAEFVP